MLNLSEINKYMRETKDWSLEGNSIVKDYTFENFSEALNFVNKIAEIAEKHNHHPDILISYNLVRLVLTTHSAGGLTKLDFDVAKEIDKL